MIVIELSDIDCEYKPITGYEDYYITCEGDVYSQRLRGNGKTPKLRKLKPKNPGKDSKYLNINLCNDSGVSTKQIHRLVAEYFVPGYFSGAVVNHKDGNNRNNSYLNLEWVTQKENINKSYDTSGTDQTRNYLWWELLDPSGNSLGIFKGNVEMRRYVKESGIPASPSSLAKYNECNGYTVKKYKKNDLC